MRNTKHWNHPDKIVEMIKRLVEVPSISGTADEAKMANTLIDILGEMPYFQQHPEHIMKCPLPNDPLSRAVVMALFRGNPSSSKTAVLLSHFDVVGVADFGNWQDYAFQPEKYTEMLRTEWYDALDREAQKDIESGDWLFARGIMDMKAGLAIQLAVTSELSTLPDFKGNILLVATPDEEVSSQGMFTAVQELNRLKQKLNLEYEVCICSEPSFSSYPGDDAKYIYTGSVGKLLPLILCVGRETHVGEPMSGLNAGWMAAEIVNKMELSDTFVEEREGEVNPPPTCLKVSDLKTEYSVQTPNLSYVLCNVLTLRQSPGDVLHKVKQAARDAADDIAGKLKKKYKVYNDGDYTEHVKVLTPNVYTYEELYKKGQAVYGPDFADRLHAILAEGDSGDLDLQHLSLKLATELAGFFIDEAPYYLIMFAPPYYPHIHLDNETASEQKIHTAIQNVVREAKETYGEDIKVKKFFGGLSDISYCRIADPETVVVTLRENMPLLGSVYRIPLYEMISLDLPAINIGPYGKDAHKRTERLALSFSTKVAPALLKSAIHHVLSNGQTVCDK